MKRLETKLGSAVFRNPVFGVSGCTGHGYELAEYADLSRFGCVTTRRVELLSSSVCGVAASCKRSGCASEKPCHKAEGSAE